MEPQTMYYLIAKDKVAKQHIWRKNSICNSFWFMSSLLKVAKIAITHLSLGLSPQNKTKKKSRVWKFIGTINWQKICTVVVLKKSMWH